MVLHHIPFARLHGACWACEEKCTSYTKTAKEKQSNHKINRPHNQFCGTLQNAHNHRKKKNKKR
jgi:hypothetical protein